MADTTNGSSNTSATTKVFETYELLEDILLHLPLRNLLLSQAVCTQWRDVAADSNKIQQALFKTSAGNYTVKCKGALREIDEDNEDDESWDDWERTWRNEQGAEVPPPLLNPFVHDFLQVMHYGYFLMHGFFDDQMEPVQVPSFYQEHASWQGMHITQPPTSEVTILCDGPAATDLSFSMDPGVTLGELAKHLKKHVSACTEQVGAWSTTCQFNAKSIDLLEVAQHTARGDTMMTGYEMLKELSSLPS